MTFQTAPSFDTVAVHSFYHIHSTSIFLEYSMSRANLVCHVRHRTGCNAISASSGSSEGHGGGSRFLSRPTPFFFSRVLALLDHQGQGRWNTVASSETWVELFRQEATVDGMRARGFLKDMGAGGERFAFSCPGWRDSTVPATPITAPDQAEAESGTLSLLRGEDAII